MEVRFWCTYKKLHYYTIKIEPYTRIDYFCGMEEEEQASAFILFWQDELGRKGPNLERERNGSGTDWIHGTERNGIEKF